MKKTLICIAVLAVIGTAMAQQATDAPPFETPSWVPDEATKIRALKRAYELNGNSMVGMGSIDLTEEMKTPPGAPVPPRTGLPPEKKR